MNSPYRYLAVALFAMTWPTLSWADVQVESKDVENERLTVFKMTVTPAPEPVPALRHRLLLRANDEKPGDAATMYYRALIGSEDLGKRLRARFGDSYIYDYPWSSESPASEKLRTAAEMVASSEMLTQLREAASRTDCDWAFDLRSIEGPELYSFVLPEMQEARHLGRHLSLLARVAIHERRYDDAIDALRINVKLARDTGAEPLLICGLIGQAIVGVGNEAMIELIAAPDSPNLYWALSELPDPLIDMGPAVRFEISSLFRMFPVLRNADTQEHSPEEWARLIAEGVQSLTGFMGPVAGMPPTAGDVTAQLGVTGMGLMTYRAAKERLIASGMDATRVEQMPVGQVMTIDAAHDLQQIGDEFEKCWYLPFAEARKQSDAAEDQVRRDRFARNYGKILAGLFLPALSAARTAQERQGWQLDGLRTVEAIRMHAAETGALPRSLADIAVVPVPTNRVTGKPYEYRLDGDTGVLELPFSDGFPNVAWRFEIKLAD
jgi:hypothetical protein